MKIDVQKLERLANKITNDVLGIYSKAGATIGYVNGVWFRLEALSDAEAAITERDNVLDANNCILP